MVSIMESFSECLEMEDDVRRLMLLFAHGVKILARSKIFW